MDKAVILLALLGIAHLACASWQEPGQHGIAKVPHCIGVTSDGPCPLNYAPVCGSDGNEYANECQLCAQRLRTRKEILIARDGPC
ncbi:probable pancreatic secretory proteinase inhibitor [Polypterus senegalus]|uniref:probable pancreatic secretory proteinase inhibitor n=1 Tax=Polypterus senegalus TaxID=55291 RepID=UPI001964D624|nr:probable pancreatic secretory proteinase inhibitor [Polypterus senegalus]